MYIHHFLFCSFSDKSAYTLKLQSMRGKKGKGMDYPPFNDRELAAPDAAKRNLPSVCFNQTYL